MSVKIFVLVVFSAYAIWGFATGNLTGGIVAAAFAILILWGIFWPPRDRSAQPEDDDTGWLVPWLTGIGFTIGSWTLAIYLTVAAAQGQGGWYVVGAIVMYVCAIQFSRGAVPAAVWLWKRLWSKTGS